MTSTPSTFDPKEILTCSAIVRCGFAEQTIRVKATRDRMVDAVREQASREFDWPIYAISILHGRIIKDDGEVE